MEKQPFTRVRVCSAAAVGSMIISTRRQFLFDVCIHTAVAIPDRYQSTFFFPSASETWWFYNVHRYADGCIFPENTNNKTIKTAHRENRKHQFISYLLKIGAEGVFNSADISVFTRERVLPSCAVNPCRQHFIGLLLWSNNRSKYGTVCLCDWVPLTLLNGPYFGFPSASPDMCGK